MKLKAIIPVPSNAGTPLLNDRQACRVRAAKTAAIWDIKLEKPEYFWPWFDQNGNLIGFIIRELRENGDKRVYTVFYCESELGKGWWQVGWRGIFENEPKPLFNLPSIVDKDKVLIVEGEKNAYLVSQELEDMGVVCNQGGSSHVNISDWSALYGKIVYVMPDNDTAGTKAAQQIIDRLQGIAQKLYLIQIPCDKPPGWDLADFITELRGER